MSKFAKSTPVVTYSIRRGDDLGAMSETHERDHITLAQVRVWLARHEDIGTFEIIDDATGIAVNVSDI